MTVDELVKLGKRYMARDIPCHAIAISWDERKQATNKRPLTAHGFEDAILEPDLLRRQLNGATLRRGEVLAIGLHLGPADIFALDVDTKGGGRGDEELAALEAEHGPLPEGPVVTTASGGTHRWHRKPEGFYVSNADLAPDVEVRGDAGFVVAPGVATPWGRWEFDEVTGDLAVPMAPDWLLNRLNNGTGATSGSPGAAKWRPLDRSALHSADLAALDALERLGGHDPYVSGDGSTMVVRPGKLAGGSASIGHIAPGVVKVFTSNWPPLVKLQRYEADELIAIADEIAARDAVLADDVADGCLFINWATFWERDREVAVWLFEPVLARGRGHALYASHKTGKSLLMLWAGAQLATGADPVVVIYLDFEMTEDDVYERLSDMGYGPDVNLDRLRYATLPSLPPLDTAAGGDALCRLVDEEQARWPDHHLVVLIDTMARAVSGDEDRADTYRSFYAHTGIKLKRRGVTWGRLDHAGKDLNRGQRGSSAKGDDVDVVWEVTRSDDGLLLKRKASRMGWVPERVALRQHDTPLRFGTQPRAWPAGTKDLADLLDRLGVAPELGERVAGATLRASGHQASQDVLRAAIRYRRERGMAA